MRKALIIFTILGLQLIANCQSITDKKWTKFHIERLDGSRVVERTNIATSSLSYLFKRNNQVIIETLLDIDSAHYSVDDSVLSIGPFQKMKILELRDELLILAEMPEEALSRDKINKIYFTTGENYAKNVINQNLVKIIDDTLILPNRYLKPKYKGISFDKFLYDGLSSVVAKNTTCEVSFIVTPERLVTDINVDLPNDSLTDLKAKLKDLLSLTYYRWDLPKTKRQFYYKVQFSIDSQGSLLGIITDNGEKTNNYSPLGLDEMDAADEYFRNGIRFLKREKYEKAIIQFNECISIDRIYLDAYYNRAYANYQLGNMNKACEDWKYLYKLGQSEATNIYLNNCLKK